MAGVSSFRRRASLGVFGAMAMGLAVTSVAWACTGLSQASHFELSPDRASRAANVEITVAGGCVGCKYDSVNNKLHFDKVPMPPLVDRTAATRVDPTRTQSNCGTSDATLKDPSNLSVAATTTVTDPVVGVGVMTADNTRPTGLYYVCSGLAPQLLWNFITVV